MTYKKYAEKLSNKKLVNKLKDLECAIEDVECFNTKDLLMREALESEAERRGICLDYIYSD